MDAIDIITTKMAHQFDLDARKLVKLRAKCKAMELAGDAMSKHLKTSQSPPTHLLNYWELAKDSDAI